MERRPLLAGLALALVGGRLLEGEVAMAGTTAGFGMIGKIKARPGTRAELVAILASGTGAMPGFALILPIIPKPAVMPAIAISPLRRRPPTSASASPASSGRRCIIPDPGRCR